ncbi:hypothetical protein KIH77_10120 [Bifidobacterium sp. 82T24]|uniref:hypothetical protein n=1 Tax=Bifidobacterium pluvialisilvae TaxID=2834436 RepID=UPI001C5934A4|nr:hypothetical protein [Bifidobacterium pluvialisilvae]MBW3089067.1 hypothetical protein [Bifidobacterium pluvialisilvae]
MDDGRRHAEDGDDARLRMLNAGVQGMRDVQDEGRRALNEFDESIGDGAAELDKTFRSMSASMERTRRSAREQADDTAERVLTKLSGLFKKR